MTTNPTTYSIIFICTGNFHRSPMAAVMFRAKVADSAETWRIESAGTWTVDGQRTTPEVLEVMRERGLDAGDHRSQLVSRDLLSDFNLILALSSNHKEALRTEFPELADRILLLSEMVGLNRDVEDPIGGPLIEFQATASEIDNYLTRGLDRICELAGS